MSLPKGPRMEALTAVHLQIMVVTKQQEARRHDYEAAVMVKDSARCDELRAQLHALLDHHLDLMGQASGLGYEIIVAGP